MNKKFAQLAVAGSLVAGLAQVGTAAAYDGVTDYKMNEVKDWVITVIDAHHDKVSVVYRNTSRPARIPRAISIYQGDIDDELLNEAQRGGIDGATEVLVWNYLNEDWTTMYQNVEYEFDTASSLLDNTTNEFGYTGIFLENAYNASTNVFRARLDYGRCVNSEAFQNDEEVICRAEIWEDGLLHYQPYIGWERISLGDDSASADGIKRIWLFGQGSNTEPEIKTVWVFGEKTIYLEPEDDDNGDDEDDWDDWCLEGEGDDCGDDNNGEDGDEKNSENEEKEVEVRYVDREVPVEKTVVKEVEKIVEVPVEKTVVKTVEVEVPVEKTVVDVREAIREIPVEGQTVVTASAEVETEDEEEKAEAEPEVVREVEEIEIPMLGKDCNIPETNDFLMRLLMFIAGVVTASAGWLAFLIVRKKKEEDARGGEMK